ncbi:MAG TPA: DUF2975 domain-containing protein [Polaromonas sp.]|uniref:DUF2975 domain-containing protein n=1 Tax=Polaromonas sp. TaxID=1869339 RepID=UPI002D3DD0D1|nr:DUF2975 domain-containing protein [Polaromonas sp.]HYW57850.1 DUF2975 domain-containing protein [Polaromonas sp.]
MKNTLSSATLSTPEVQRLNSAFAWACALLAVALPVAVCYHLMTTPTVGLLLRAGVNLSAVQAQALDVSFLQRSLAVALGMTPVLCASYGLVCAMRCFSGFSQGEYFSLRTVRYLRGFAAGIFASVVAGFFASMLISVVLTAGAPAGQKALAFGLGSNELLTLLFAGMVWQIAAVMAKAVALAEENAQFV